MVSGVVVGLDIVFVEGYMMRNKDWVGIVKCSDLQILFELFVDNRLVIK